LDADRAGDLDIVVCLPGDPGLPYRQSLRWHGWPVELFVHDEDSLQPYLAKDLAARRPALHRMLATGHLVGGHGDDAARVRTGARRRWPPAGHRWPPTTWMGCVTGVAGRDRFNYGFGGWPTRSVAP
jgi:hypothetical protein